MGYFLINRAYSNILESGSNEAAINLWVKNRVASFGTDKIAEDYPPVRELNDPLKIRSREDLLWKGGKPPKAYEDIANSMIDCWRTFDRGKSDFINAVEKEPFCFQCRAISFSDEIKKEKLIMVGFNSYLNDQKIAGKSSPSYIQYLANDNLYNMSEEEIGEDKIIVERDLYIYLFAASGRGIVNIMTNVLGLGDVVPEGTGEKVHISTQTTTSTSSEQGEASLIASGTVAGGKATTYTLNTLKNKVQQAAIENAAKTGAVKAAETAVGGYGVYGNFIIGEAAKYEATQAGEKVVVSVVAKAAEEKLGQKAAQKVAEKAASGVMRRLLLNVGSKVVGGPIGWFVIGGTAAYGTYNIVFGEKPFTANVMLVDPTEINILCNAKTE